MKKITYFEAEELAKTIDQTDPTMAIMTAYNVAVHRHNERKREAKQLKRESKELKEKGLFKKAEKHTNPPDYRDRAEYEYYFGSGDKYPPKIIPSLPPDNFMNDPSNQFPRQINIVSIDNLANRVDELEKNCIKAGQKVVLEERLLNNKIATSIVTIDKIPNIGK